MDPTLTFCIFQCCIVIPFCSGIALRKRFPDPADFTKKLLRINIILIEPLIALWCIWGL
ncbi:MAG: hypothetical protein GY868_08085, partial [Deltaproteobacteria bacterium]|nr:hypothetical protein [Deltaproteobacteria bacterium]